MQMQSERLQEYIDRMSRDLVRDYSIPAEMYENQDIKRGLRNNDGTGVLVGISKVGSVQGYYMVDGQRVPMPGKLYYRGISVEDIVDAHQQAGTFGYEEVAYLLLLGRLPAAEELAQFNQILANARQMPAAFTEDMILKAPSRNIMNQLARSVLALYSFDDNADDASPENILRQSIELIARFPVIAAYAYVVKRHYFDNDSLYLHRPEPELSTAENFLRMLREDCSYTDLEARTLDVALILHADNGGGNNSTFTNHVVTSSGTDTYSAIAASMASLKGPRHGGANSKVMAMMDDVKEHVRDWNDEGCVADYLTRILNKDAFDRSGLIYGLGHAVYTKTDPRCEVFRAYVNHLAAEKGREDELALYANVEKVGKALLMERQHKKALSTNIDFYSGFVYEMLGLPMELYTPLFAIARIVGWCAHRVEELYTGGRIIRPAYKYVGQHRTYQPLGQR